MALTFLVYPLSEIITRKRVIIIESSSSNYETEQINPLPLAKDERINAFFLGIPGEGNNAPDLTDSIMITSINPETNQGFLLSIPRDLLIKLPEANSYIKINALYQEMGIDTVETLLSEITGLNFDYKIAINLKGVKESIDRIGGINIFIEENIYDPAFPGPNNSYQLFTIKKGWHHLDGKTALKYIRTRHTSRGDFDRMARQQQVLMALKDKISSLNPIWNLAVVFNIWQTTKKYLDTNLSLFNIKKFWQLAKNIDLEKIDFRVLDTDTDLLVSGHTFLGNEQAYILKPRAGLDNYEEIREYINNL